MNTLQKYEKYFYFIILIGVVIYFPIFFNGFVWDDFPFIINNPQVHQVNLAILFGNNLFNTGPFYRPIPAVYFAVLYTLSGKAAFFYHLLQLFLHCIGTFLLFIFFCAFFSDYIAFFLALVFLVHPINIESVAYIGSTQSELYFIPGISALLLAKQEKLSNRKFYLTIFFLLLSIFTKEVGFLFLFLAIVYRALFKLGAMRKFFLYSGIIVLFYAVMRVFYGGVTYSTNNTVTIVNVPLFVRMLNIPSIIVYYLHIFFFPVNLLIWQTWVVKSISFSNFIFPLLLSSIFFGCIALTGYLLLQKRDTNHKNNKTLFKTFLFFFIWYIAGMGMLLQIVPLDMTVADRWFYFPIVGLLGMIGIMLTAWLPSFKTYKTIYLVFASIILFLLASRTFVRTFDYKDDMTLQSHDIRAGNDNYYLLNEYGTELFEANKINEGCKYIKKAASLGQDAAIMNELGDCFQEEQQYDDAISAYEKAIQLHRSYDDSPLPIYLNLAQTFILNDQPQEAISLIKNSALPQFQNNAKLLQLLNNAQAQINFNGNNFQFVGTPNSQGSQNNQTTTVNSQLYHDLSSPML